VKNGLLILTRDGLADGLTDTARRQKDDGATPPPGKCWSIARGLHHRRQLLLVLYHLPALRDDLCIFQWLPTSHGTAVAHDATQTASKLLGGLS